MPYSRTLKISEDHYEFMRERMAEALRSLPAEKVARVRAATSPKRFAWDVARGAGLINFMCEALYRIDVNDENITPALQRIVSDILDRE